jgi:hypothetical protein
VTLGFPPAEGPAAGDDVRRKALRDDLRGFLESNEKDRPGPASPPSVAAGAPDFDADLFLDDLFAGAKKGTPIGDLLEPVRSDPAGEIILAFLREELRNNIPLLRQHAEPGPEGRWRLRKESVEFFRAWLADELDQDRKRAEREKRADLPSPAPAKPAARPPRVRLGLFVRDLEPAERSASGVAEGAGFVVNRLVPEGPAMRAGLRPGDVVVKIDGRPATEALLQETLAKARPGDAVNFTVVRAARGDAPGATLDVKVGAEGVRDLSEPRAPKGPGTK